MLRDDTPIQVYEHQIKLLEMSLSNKKVYVYNPDGSVPTKEQIKQAIKGLHSKIANVERRARWLV